MVNGQIPKQQIGLNIQIGILQDGTGIQLAISFLTMQFAVIIPKGAGRGLGQQLIEADRKLDIMIINPNDKSIKNV